MRHFTFAFIITAVLCLMPSMLKAEYVFLTDGSIISGTIVKEDAKTVTLQTGDKNKQKIDRDKIMRILYTELNFGKILVQKKNGKSFTAYMVDEDRETYTFRNDLYKPEEFKVKRSEVLFIAERTPSGLEGEAETDSIKLSWYPPYDKMEKYNIYVKKKGDDKFTLYATTDSTSYEMEELPGNTTFFIKVTGIDPKNDETPASNELEITTKNSPPAEPESLRMNLQGDGSVDLSWNASTDRDGKIAKYIIYTMEGGSRKTIAETPDTRRTIAAGTVFDTLYIVAVDDLGAESGEERFYWSHQHGLMPGISMGIIIPMGNFADLAGVAYGMNISFTYMGLFWGSFEAGFETGCYYMTGKDSMNSDNQKTESAILVPMYVYTGYRFHVTDNFSITPYIEAGAMYLNMKYIQRDFYTFEERDKTLSEFGPAVNGGLSFTYRFSQTIFATLRGSFGYMPGADGGMFISTDMGITSHL